MSGDRRKLMKPQRKFKYNLQESVDLCVLMMLEAQAQKTVDISEVKYWVRRIHDYQNVATKRGTTLKVPELPVFPQ